MRSLIEDEDTEEIEIPPNGISLDLLRAVYRNKSLPLPTRMRAAGMAIPFECAKLMAVAQVSERDFATLLDQRIAKIERTEQQKLPAPATNGGSAVQPQQIEAPAPKAHTPDRRFRRV